MKIVIILFMRDGASTYHNIFSNGQYAIVKYTSSYECNIITIFTNTIETKIWYEN